MASLIQLKELFNSQEEKDIKRREKEKEEVDLKRKEDKEEVKEMFRSHMLSVKEDIKDIKIKQDQIEGQVMAAEDKLTKKYDDMASKVGELENKIRGMEMRDKATKELEEESARKWPGPHLVGSQQSSCQPPIHPVGREQLPGQPAVHPAGRQQSSCQPTAKIVQLKDGKVETNKEIYSIVKQARKTVGFSPINFNHVQEVMDEMVIQNTRRGIEEAVKDFLRSEMAMPEEVIEKLQFVKTFWRSQETDDDKLFVEFAEEGMQGIVFKYVRKMRRKCNLITYIPETFRKRAAKLERAAYDMRHAEPSYNTRVKWGWGDLILERKPRGSRESYRSVYIPDLPPVELSATPRVRLPTATSSPAPGRKNRTKRPGQSDFQ